MSGYFKNNTKKLEEIRNLIHSYGSEVIWARSSVCKNEGILCSINSTLSVIEKRLRSLEEAQHESCYGPWRVTNTAVVQHDGKDVVVETAQRVVLRGIKENKK